MERNHKFICWFLLRLLLICNLHFRNHFTVLASEIQLEEMSFNDEFYFNKNLNDQMAQMEARQENEIGTLKTTLSEDRKRMNDLEGRVAVLESSSVITGTTKLGRPKRPARLLPDSILFGKQKNKTIIEVERFYGPATSCDDLRKLGYTLNGHYLVSAKIIPSIKSSISSKIEVIFCQFKQPQGAKEADKEKRLGAISIITNNGESSLISQPLTTTKPQQSKCLQINHLKRSDQDFCLTVADSNAPGIPWPLETPFLVQSKCDRSYDQQKWVHYGKHICQYTGEKCITVIRDSDNAEPDLVLTPYSPRDNSQQWTVDIRNDNQVVNDQAYCFVTQENNRAEAKVVAQKCDIQKKGIRWNFVDLFPLTRPSACASSSAVKKKTRRSSSKKLIIFENTGMK